MFVALQPRLKPGADGAKAAESGWERGTMPPGTTPRLAIWRLAIAGLLLPTAFVVVDYFLLIGLSGAFRTDWLMVLTMAIFVFQIGLMGVVCGNLTDWPTLRWVLYGWCWVLIDFQTLIAWAFAEQSWWFLAFQAVAIFSAQLGLVTIWMVLGAMRWTMRWPVAVVLIVFLMLPLIRIRYRGENAALLFVVQFCLLWVACVALRWQGYSFTRVAAREHLLSKPTSATDLLIGQFGVRDVLVWTTALAIVCGMVRAVGLPSEQWMEHRYQSPLPLLCGGTAASMALILAMWAGLGTGSARFRWSLLLFAIPAIGLGAGVINWLDTLRQWRPWPAWAIGRPWWDWVFWDWLYYHERFTVAWISLAGGMLFAALLFPRALGFRLRRETVPV
jgi:hypothetical protein